MEKRPPTSRTVQNIADVLQSGARQLAQASEARDKIFGKVIPKKSEAMIELEQSAQSMFGDVKSSTIQLEQPFKDLGDTVSQVRVRFAELLETTSALIQQRAAGIPVIPPEQLFQNQLTSKESRYLGGIPLPEPKEITGPGTIASTPPAIQLTPTFAPASKVNVVLPTEAPQPAAKINVAAPDVHVPATTVHSTVETTAIESFIQQILETLNRIANSVIAITAEITKPPALEARVTPEQAGEVLHRVEVKPQATRQTVSENSEFIQLIISAINRLGNQLALINVTLENLSFSAPAPKITFPEVTHGPVTAKLAGTEGLQQQLSDLGTLPSTAYDSILKNSEQSFQRIISQFGTGKPSSVIPVLPLLQVMEGQVKSLITPPPQTNVPALPQSTAAVSYKSTQSPFELPRAPAYRAPAASTDTVTPALREIQTNTSQMATELIQIDAKAGNREVASPLPTGGILASSRPEVTPTTVDTGLQLPAPPPYQPPAVKSSNQPYDINIQINHELLNSSNALVRAFNSLRAGVENTEHAIGGLFTKKQPVIEAAQQTASSQQVTKAPGLLPLMKDELSAVFKGGEGKYGSGTTADGKKTYGSSTEALASFATALTTAVSGVAGFVQTITSAKSGIAGALGGASSGAGIGSMFGPIGTGIGAAVGAVMGGIMGEKNRQVQRNLDNATANFKIIMADFALNNNNLQQTVLAIQAIISQLQYQKSQSKKGGSQFDQAIQQYRDQLQQLQTQQTQMMISLHQQVSVLSAPQGMQDLLGSLQQMLKQYEQFVGAARDANDLAEANKFLAESFSNLETNALQQFNQDETQAIQDALQLNDLLYQRQDLIRQYNDQVQGILSQGVLTRQLTMAQTKGQQIEKISADYQRQQEQMNEQISVQQYRVQAESQIFQLATTRTTLEMQLATVQKQAVDADMLRISALTQLVQAFQTGDWSFQPIQDIINSMQGVSNPSVGVGTGSLFGGGNINGALANALDALVSGAYQDRSVSGYATFRGQGL